MKHHRISAILTAAIAGAALVGCTGASTTGAKTANGQAAEGGLIGKAAPPLHVEPVGGDGPKSLEEAKGTVTIVDFWATFCEPCRKSFPKYQELVDTHSGKLFVLAVSVDDPDVTSPEKILEFANQTSVSFPILWDKEKKTAPTYDPPTMPTSYVIDKNGVIRHIHVGYTPAEADQISKEVEALIAE